MKKLILTSFIWAFSFSFIGEYLAGKVDSYLAILIRFGLASLILTPFLKTEGLSRSFIFKVLAIGALQIGMMYIFFYQSFLFLSVPEVILFTITTPIIIEIIGDFKNRNFSVKTFLAVLSTVVGAYIIKRHQVNPGFMKGFILVQLCNFCFGLGQILYKEIINTENKLRLINKRSIVKDKNIFALFFYGAFLFIIPVSFSLSNYQKLPNTIEQYAVLLWLGIIASGIGYLLWNSGARTVNHSLLASMNNFIIPLGITVNFFLWNKTIDLLPFLLGAVFIILPIIFLNHKDRLETLRLKHHK